MARMRAQARMVLITTAIVLATARNNSHTINSYGVPYSWMPWLDPNNAGVTVLEADPEGRDLVYTRRDTFKDPKRDPGPINPQRYVTGLQTQWGFPTLLGAPLAFNTDDLKAGQVDVALFGMPIDDNVMAGSRFAPNTMRALRDWQNYPVSGVDQHIGVDWASALNIVDYGNANPMFNQPERGLEEVHKVVTEILDADAMPIGIGGTHINSYGFMTALAKKYGEGEVAVLHVDAHTDIYLTGMGRHVHNGNFFTVAINSGLINGTDLVQVGLRSQNPSDKNLQVMKDMGVRYHMMVEINVKGWEATLRRILDELAGKLVYITFDVDGVDPAYAPGVTTQDPDGLTATQALQLVRAVGIQNEVVAADFVEYNPLMDDNHQTTGVLIDRLVRSLLAGIAARRTGVTSDPFYADPKRVDW